MKASIEIVNTKKVKCEGEGQDIGHPLVYLEIDSKNEKKCPYCSKIFKFTKYVKGKINETN